MTQVKGTYLIEQKEAVKVGESKHFKAFVMEARDNYSYKIVFAGYLNSIGSGTVVGAGWYTMKQKKLL